MTQVVKNRPEMTIPNQYILGRPNSNGRAKTVRSSSITSALRGFGIGLHAHEDINGGVRVFPASRSVSSTFVGGRTEGCRAGADGACCTLDGGVEMTGRLFGAA